MKKIICLLVLLSLASGVQAGDKKKKSSSGGSAPARASGGGNRGGGGLPGMSHSAGPASGHSNAPRSSSHSAPSLGSHTSSVGHASKSTSHNAGSGTATAHSNNPLLRKNGQAGANQHGANPLKQGNRQAGAGQTNPLTKKGASQAGMNGRKGDLHATRNNANVGRNHGQGAQAGRGLNNRVGHQNWAHASHANYRVRPYRDVYHNYHPYRHDRYWYNSRYDRVVVVGGGYYYWDAGYWYPAWGYDPAIAFYAYDGPIYSYDNLPPDQVTMNVQTALQDEGYYTGEIDGLVGPKTRDALGAYQTDHDLEVTSAVDEPTVEALGLAQST